MPIDIFNAANTSRVLKQLNADHPTLLKKITLESIQDLGLLLAEDKINIAQYAVEKGNVSLLDAIKQWLPALLKYDERDWDQSLLLFHAVEAEHLDVLDWFLKNAPDFFEGGTSSEPTIAYGAGWRLKYKVLNWCLAHKPDLFKAKYFQNFVRHVISWLNMRRIVKEDIENFLDWVKEKMPERFVESDKQGLNVAHGVAEIGCMPAFLWIEKNQPELMSAKSTDNGSTILHHAAKVGNSEVFIHVLKNNPELAKQLWILNKDGDTPFMCAISGFNPNAIRENLLREATLRIADNRPEATDVRLLVAFQNEWLEFMLESAMCDERLVDKVDYFPAELQAALKKSREMSTLKKYTFPEGIITRKTLEQLVELAHKSLPSSSHVDFFKVSARKNIKLLTELQCLLRACTTDTLEAKHELCLQVLIKDAEYALEREIRRSGSSLHIMIVVLIIKLLKATETVQRLQPMPEKTKEQEDDVLDVQACFADFETKVKNHPLSAGTKETMQEVVLPGLKKLIFEQEQIIEAIRQKPNELYMLHEKLPLHTEHNTVDGVFDAAGYRETLKRLVVNIFAAVTQTYEKGVFGTFCDKLAIGYCFEGRVRDTLEWVVSYSGVKSFEDTIYDILYNQYIPYAEIILGFSETDVYSMRNVLCFILARHYNLPCQADPQYARDGKIVFDGLKKYLEVLNMFESIPAPSAAI